MKKNLYGIIFCHFVLLLALSFFSNYSLPNFQDSNWTTVLFLTPYGILVNLLGQNSALNSFYFDLSNGNIAWSTQMALPVFVSYLLLVFLARFYFVKRNRN